MTGKADVEKLEKLHGDFADALANNLSEQGSNAAFMAVVRAFLRDQGIKSTPKANSAAKRIVDSIPQFDEDDAETPHGP